jgi:hypothetical protein
MRWVKPTVRSSRNASLATANAPQRIEGASTALAIPEAVGVCSFPQRMQRTQRMRWAVP